MTETLAILAKNKVERLSRAHQNVTGAAEISKSSCIYRLYHASDYVPSTYLLDVMTETLAMLALLLAIMHYYPTFHRTVNLPRCCALDQPEAGDARKSLSLSSAAAKTLAKLSCARFRAQLLIAELLA